MGGSWEREIVVGGYDVYGPPRKTGAASFAPGGGFFGGVSGRRGHVNSLGCGKLRSFGTSGRGNFHTEGEQGRQAGPCGCSSLVCEGDSRIHLSM